MLTKIDSPRDVQKAWATLNRAVAARARRERRTLGSQEGTSSPKKLYVREDLGIWMAPSVRTDKGYMWCPFGTTPLRASGNLDMIVQINPAISPDSRPTAGLLAVDTDGSRWICHTGRIGGGRPGIGKSAFVAWTDRETARVIDDRGRKSTVFPITRVGGARMASDVAEFVHEVAAFKADQRPPTRTLRPGPFGGSEDEREGASQVESRSGYTMTRTHGLVRNRLRDLLVRAGFKVSRDTQRDLVVGKPRSPQFEFEIKASADSQSIYTAVGQLLMHGCIAPAKRRIAVLPDGVAPKRAAAVRALGIEIVTFRIGDERIVFTGLNRVVPEVGSSAPIISAKS